MTAVVLPFPYLNEVVAEGEIKFAVKRHRGGHVSEKALKLSIGIPLFVVATLDIGYLFVKFVWASFTLTKAGRRCAILFPIYLERETGCIYAQVNRLCHRLFEHYLVFLAASA